MAHWRILLRIDENSSDPEDEPMGEDHPVSWRNTYGNGRTWYSALGHGAQAYADQAFRDHLWGGVLSVLRPQACFTGYNEGLQRILEAFVACI